MISAHPSHRRPLAHDQWLAWFACLLLVPFDHASAFHCRKPHNHMKVKITGLKVTLSKAHFTDSLTQGSNETTSLGELKVAWLINLRIGIDPYLRVSYAYVPFPNNPFVLLRPSPLPSSFPSINTDSIKTLYIRKNRCINLGSFPYFTTIAIHCTSGRPKLQHTCITASSSLLHLKHRKNILKLGQSPGPCGILCCKGGMFHSSR